MASQPLAPDRAALFGCGGFTLVVLAWREISRSAARHHDTRRRRIMTMADAAEQRWKADRKRSFNFW